MLDQAQEKNIERHIKTHLGVPAMIEQLFRSWKHFFVQTDE